ncbi:amidohydrolase family protein [Candidatus Poribacteria bacterium]|nr:amidohydrolase family protein [Candidatus Poribacteria bacterium]
MKFDIHFHMLGNGKEITEVDEDVYLGMDDNHHWFTRILANLLDKELKLMGADFDKSGEISTCEYLAFTYGLLATSEEIDALVLLALDGVYEDGKLDKRKTDLMISNRFLSEKVKILNAHLQAEDDPKKREKRFFFGASVSPNRKEDDLRQELAFVLEETDAVLMKLIPSTQHIRLRNAGHKGFFEALRKAGMPLLCHVGPEYSFPEGIQNKQLDHFRHLEHPLDCGVTVIAAHCATPVFPVVDPNTTKDFLTFMKERNAGGRTRLYADTSALSLATRTHLIPGIVKEFPPEWLVHGSDFPIPIDGWPHLPWVTHDMTPAEYTEIVRTKNPLDRDVRIKRAHGFSKTILENAEKVLRLPKPPL